MASSPASSADVVGYGRCTETSHSFNRLETPAPNIVYTRASPVLLLHVALKSGSSYLNATLNLRCCPHLDTGCASVAGCSTVDAVCSPIPAGEILSTCTSGECSISLALCNFDQEKTEIGCHTFYACMQNSIEEGGCTWMEKECTGSCRNAQEQDGATQDSLALMDTVTVCMDACTNDQLWCQAKATTATTTA